jgi:hypothetical protein
MLNYLRTLPLALALFIASCSTPSLPAAAAAAALPKEQADLLFDITDKFPTGIPALMCDYSPDLYKFGVTTTTTSKPITSLTALEHTFRFFQGIYLSPHGSTMVVHSKTPRMNSLELVDITTGKPVRSLAAFTGQFIGTAWSRNGNYLAYQTSAPGATLYCVTVIKPSDGSRVATYPNAQLFTWSSSDDATITILGADEQLKSYSMHSTPTIAQKTLQIPHARIHFWSQQHDRIAYIDRTNNNAIILGTLGSQDTKALPLETAITDEVYPFLQLSPNAESVALGYAVGVATVLDIYSCSTGKLLHRARNTPQGSSTTMLEFSWFDDYALHLSQQTHCATGDCIQQAHLVPLTALESPLTTTLPATRTVKPFESCISPGGAHMINTTPKGISTLTSTTVHRQAALACLQALAPVIAIARKNGGS